MDNGPASNLNDWQKIFRHALEQERIAIPEWARYVTLDANGEVWAWDSEPLFIEEYQCWDYRDKGYRGHGMEAPIGKIVFPFGVSECILYVGERSGIKKIETRISTRIEHLVPATVPDAWI